MKNSIYSTCGGMLTTAERLNILANNIANVKTPGFKSDLSFEQTIRFLAEGPYPGKDQPVVGGTNINMLAGPIKHTGRKLDLAFKSDGFFSVQGPNNRTLYTRNGAFNLNSQRQLVTAEGYPVLDKFDKPITLFGQEHYFSPAGDLIIDGNYFTTLKMADIEDQKDISKLGDNFFMLNAGVQPPEQVITPDLEVGALEQANVNIMKGITEMVQIERTFEMQKTATDLIFKSIRKVISDIAKPS